MLDSTQLDQIQSATVYDQNSDKIGKVGEVYLDDSTNAPAWATVNTGFFGTSESFVPLADATWDGDNLLVPYAKDTVKDAPKMDADGSLSPQEEQELYAYYGLGTGTYDAGTTGYTTDTTTDVPANGSDDAMTLSAERVEVGTRTQETGRVRLRKYVVTENVTQTVPVQREKAVLERVPITEDNVDAATSGAEISESEHEIVLHEEVPVVQKTVEAVERVRLGTEVVTDQETVSEDVRREEIDVDGDVDTSRS